MSDNLFDSVCNKEFSSVSALNKHLKSASHLKQIKLNEMKEAKKDMTEEDIKKQLKKAVQKNFYCPLCDFKTKNLEDISEHKSTQRHRDNFTAYEHNMKIYKNTELFNEFKNDLTDNNIFIGIVKGKEYTKDDILKKYNVIINPEKKGTVSLKERVKYGENKEKDPNDEKIKKLENLIKGLEKAYQKYLKKVEKYKKEGGLNPDLSPGTKKFKEQYADIDELKQKLEKLKQNN
jgi:hypothetical protein